MTTLRQLRALHRLARAQLTSRAARVLFLDTGRTTSERTVGVVGLSFDPPRWLVATWHAGRGSLRVLDLSRFLCVETTRKGADAAPPGFDATWFAERAWLEDRPGGTPRVVTFRVERPWDSVSRALLPGAEVVATDDAGATLRIRASRPGVVGALVESLTANGYARLEVRPMPAKDYEARLLKLAAWILSQERAVTRAEIYAAFPDQYRGKADTKERKFTRDKDALRALGFNVETEELGGDEQVGYAIEPHSSLLPAIELTPDEAAAAWTAGVAALRLSPHPMRGELESALRKLVVATRGLPPRAATTEDLATEGEPPPPGPGKLVKKLQDAWESRTRIRIGYWRVATGEVVERDVDVFGWARRRGEWIFVGHCHLRRAVRIFYLSRVRSMARASVPKTELEARAKQGRKGHYDIPEAFDVRAWSRQMPWDYAVHAPLGATVRFRGSLAGIARNLLPAAEHSREPDGARVAKVQVLNLRGLVRQALAWGPEAELVAPPEGRAMAREILSQAVSASSGARGSP